MSDDEKTPETFGGWEEPSRLYREIWLKATPVQRLRKLQELMDLAREAAKANRKAPR